MFSETFELLKYFKTYLICEIGKLSFAGQLEQLLLGPVDVLFRAANSHLIAPAIGAREFDGHAAAVFHDGMDQFALSTDKRIVELRVDGDFLADDIRQLVLDAFDLFARPFDVLGLAGDGDAIAFVAFGRQIDFGVGVLSDFTNIDAVCKKTG